MKIIFENYFLPIDIALRVKINCKKYSLVEFETSWKEDCISCNFSFIPLYFNIFSLLIYKLIKKNLKDN